MDLNDFGMLVARRSLPPRRRWTKQALAVACSLVLAGPVQATNFVWSTAGTGVWTDSARWTPAGVPSAGDTVTFNTAAQNGDETVYLNGSRTNGSLTFTNTGGTTILGGTAGSPANQSLLLTSGLSVSPGAGAVTIGSGTAGVDLRLGASQTVANASDSLLTFSGNVVLTNATLTLTGSGDTLVSRALLPTTGSSSAGLVKSGTGNLTLAGANTATNATTLACGTLTLDYGTQDNSKLADTASLTLAGGALVLAGGTHTEVVSATTLNAGASSLGRSSGSATLRLNTITRNSGATLNLVSGGIADFDNALANGLVGAYATVGAAGAADWASTAAASGADRSIQALASYASFASAGAASNVLLSGSGSLSANRTNNTLKITTTDFGQTLDLGGKTLTMGGLLFIGANDYAIDSGLLRGSTNSTSELIVQQWGAGTLTLGAPVTNFNGNSILTKSGPGTLVLGASNAYAGATYILQGTVRPGVANAFTSLSAITLANGATLDFSSVCPAVGSLAGTTGGGGTVTLGANTLVVGGTNTAVSDFSGLITGSGGLTKTGISTQKLSGANTYTGVTTINQGTLSVATFRNVNTASGLGTGTGSAGDLVIAGGSLRFDAALGGTDTTNGFASTDRLFTFGSANSSTATIDSSAACSDGLNALVFTSTAAIPFGSSTPHTLVLAGSHNGVDGDATTRLITRASTFMLGIGDDAAGHPTSLSKTGAGVWNLVGTNSFSGGVTAYAGRLIAGTTNSLGSGPVTVLNGGEVALTASGGVYTNAVSIAGTGPNLPSMAAWWATSYAGALAVVNNAVQAGPVTLTGDASITALQMYGDLSAKVGTIAGAITGSYALTIGGNGGADNGTIILSNDANDWRGNTILAAGSGASSHCVYLNNGASDVIPNGAGRGNLVLNGMGDWSRVYYSLNGYNETINGLVSSGSLGSLMVQNNSTTTASTLTLGDADTTARYGGPIQNGSSKALAITKIGAGMQTFAGACSYTGPTIISNGTLWVSGSLSGTASVSINSNAATLIYSGVTAFTKPVTNNAGGTFRYSSMSNYTGTLTWNSGRLGGTNWNGSALSSLAIGSGRTIAPGDGIGTSVTASQTWSSAGACEIAFSNTAMTAGTGWSWLAVSNTLDIASLSTAAPFTIKVITLNAAGAVGAAPGFNGRTPCTLPFVGFGCLKGTFSSSLFAVDTSGVANTFPGTFKVVQSGSALALQYSLSAGTTVLFY